MKTAVGRQLPHNEVIWKMYGRKICFPFLCNLGNGENVLCSSKAIVMKHIRKKQGQWPYLFTNSQITNLLTCDPESSLLSQINMQFQFIILTELKHAQRIQMAPCFWWCKFKKELSAYFRNLQ